MARSVTRAAVLRRLAADLERCPSPTFVAMTAARAAGAPPDLVGWQDIADFLGVSLRTAKGLLSASHAWQPAAPIRMLRGRPAAFSVELAAWRESKRLPYRAGAYIARLERDLRAAIEQKGPPSNRRTRRRA